MTKTWGVWLRGVLGGALGPLVGLLQGCSREVPGRVFQVVLKVEL